ncbi:kinase-like domain-containing protein [Coniochaeta sp. 2T2.1]|nr:kinase-like domain-containing protein [Coniochaeta sp. 2T2.1]
MSTFRVCAECCRCLPPSSFTSTQLSKGTGWSRCVSCVHGHCNDAPAEKLYDMGRYNQSAECYFGDLAIENPIAEGTFRLVAKGEYTAGQRNGQACVGKWYKWGLDVDEDDLREDDLGCVDKAQYLVERWNQLNIANKRIRINVPEVWDLRNGMAFEIDDDDYEQPIMVEPFIHNYRKWNSNSGWYDDSTVWGEVMQALSHFSYHISGGSVVLCDLQGGVYQREVVLSDPVIISQWKGEYGSTDIGPDGSSTFFNEHECNEFCRPNWIYPAAVAQYFQPTMGTTMLRNDVPTMRAAPATTRCWS